MTDQLRTEEQVQAQLGCGRTKVFQLIRDRELRSVKIGKRRMITQSSIDELVARMVEV